VGGGGWRAPHNKLSRCSECNTSLTRQNHCFVPPPASVLIKHVSLCRLFR
jgi:uncharacterized protein with PIN domain